MNPFYSQPSISDLMAEIISFSPKLSSYMNKPLYLHIYCTDAYNSDHHVHLHKRERERGVGGAKERLHVREMANR